MSSEKFLDSKYLKRLDKELESLISRVGLDRKTQDEVFDKSTLHALEKLISDRVIDIIDFPISTGKEGNIFRAVTPQKKLVAVKIYRINTATFKHISGYIIGDPRFKSLHKTKRDIIFAWTKKEYKNLQRLEKIGVLAPEPIVYLKNVLVMSYIGSQKKAAPLMKNVVLTNPKEIFETLIDYITKMYKKAELVHGDMSAFNVLIYRKKPYLIDLGQGVLTEHQNSHDFLKRDIHNIVSYFKKYKIKTDAEEIYKNITKKSG
jgi:RIO kinase 1